MYIEGYDYKPISTATTTVVKAAPGLLHSVSVNAKGTVASTVTVYDALTAVGTPIATIDSLNLAGTFTFDANFSTALTIVTTGTAAPNLTISYR